MPSFCWPLALDPNPATILPCTGQRKFGAMPVVCVGVLTVMAWTSGSLDGLVRCAAPEEAAGGVFGGLGVVASPLAGALRLGSAGLAAATRSGAFVAGTIIFCPILSLPSGSRLLALASATRDLWYLRAIKLRVSPAATM